MIFLAQIPQIYLNLSLNLTSTLTYIMLLFGNIFV